MFSVVIPLYNKGPHIERALESVRRQSLAPKEIIIVDDGSSDGGWEYVSQLRDPLIRVERRTEPGPGGYAARNHAIGMATQPWIAFLDADDVWKPEHLLELNGALASAHDDVHCVFGAFAVVGESGSRPYRLANSLISQGGQPLHWGTIVNAWLEVGQCPIWTGAVAIRTETLKAVGSFPAGRATTGGDKDLWLRTVMAGRTIFSPQITSEFHQDTVNRVSKSRRPAVLPIISETIKSILPDSPQEHRKLLMSLSNQEVVLYARMAAKRGLYVSSIFQKSLLNSNFMKYYCLIQVYRLYSIMPNFIKSIFK